MKQLFAYIPVAVFLFLTACDGPRIKGSGNMSREERQLTGAYHKLDVRGSMDVYFTQGPASAAVVEAEDNILPYIELIEENDRLIIRTKHNIWLAPRKEIKVTLSAPDVDAVNLSGSGNVRLTNTLTTKEKVDLDLSGSGDIYGILNSPEVNASIAGSGNIKIGGETRHVSINIAGSGDFEGKELLSENANISIAGSGDANVHASVKLSAEIAGSGSVYYKGEPEVSSKILGSGSVQKK